MTGETRREKRRIKIETISSKKILVLKLLMPGQARQTNNTKGKGILHSCIPFFLRGRAIQV